MRCTNRRSSRTLKTAVLMVCLALVMLLLLCSGCRFFHTKKEVSQLSRRTNLIQKYRARGKKTHDQRKEKKKSNAQADSMLFIVSFLYILFCFARHLCCLFFVYVVFRVFFFVRNIFRLILSRTRRELRNRCVFFFILCWCCLCRIKKKNMHTLCGVTQTHSHPC